MKKTGTANLPLHTGKAPRWLFKKMEKLAGAISKEIIYEYGESEFLNRVSNPYWFQAFGNVLGFDFHSSGLTTTVCGALKESLNDMDLGVEVAGGKGRVSRKTPEELENSSIALNDVDDLIRSSKMSAKVDTSVVQDSYQLYHHVILYSEDGKWSVVQQGLNDNNGYARRYHWLSDNVDEFVEEPHNAVCCDSENETLNLTAKPCEEARNVSVDLVNDNPNHLRKFFDGQSVIGDFTGSNKKLHMRRGHWIKSTDLSERDWKVLRRAYEIQPEDYEELVAIKGMGPKKVRALALVANVVHGSEVSWKDPVKYSFAHGGKDGTPRPIDKESYDNTIQTLQESVQNSDMKDKDKRKALKKLSEMIE